MLNSFVLGIVNIQDGTFLILPHAVVQKYRMNKAKDHDRWIKSMGRLHQGLVCVVTVLPLCSIHSNE